MRCGAVRGGSTDKRAHRGQPAAMVEVSRARRPSDVLGQECTFEGRQYTVTECGSRRARLKDSVTGATKQLKPAEVMRLFPDRVTEHVGGEGEAEAGAWNEREEEQEEQDQETEEEEAAEEEPARRPGPAKKKPRTTSNTRRLLVIVDARLGSEHAVKPDGKQPTNPVAKVERDIVRLLRGLRDDEYGSGSMSERQMIVRLTAATPRVLHARLGAAPRVWRRRGWRERAAPDAHRELPGEEVDRAEKLLSP